MSTSLVNSTEFPKNDFLKIKQRFSQTATHFPKILSSKQGEIVFWVNEVLELTFS